MEKNEPRAQLSLSIYDLIHYLKKKKRNEQKANAEAMNNTKQSIMYTHFKRFMRNIWGGVRNSGWFFSRRLIFKKIKNNYYSLSPVIFMHNQKDV